MMEFDNLGHLEKIRMFENSNAYDTALKLCEQSKYLNDPTIQSERLYILMRKLYNYDEAYEVFKSLKRMKNPEIQAKGILILKELGRYEELEELIRDNGYMDSVNYAMSLIKYYVSKKDFKKALQICNYPLYADKVDIIAKRKKIEKNTERVKNDLVCTALIRLYADDITVEEINNLDIKPFHKDVLTLAYYEQHNHKKGIEEGKKFKNNPKYEKEQIKILNSILERLISKKKKIFDITIYANALHRSFDLEEANYYIEDKKSKQDFKNIIDSIKGTKDLEIDNSINNKKEENVTLVKSKKQEKKYVGSIGSNVNNRYNSNNNINTPIHTPLEREVLIKDILSYEIEDLQKYIYCMMQDDITCRKAIRAWDNLEALAYKPITDRQSLAKIVNILLKVNDKHPEIMETDTKKLVKILNNNN